MTALLGRINHLMLKLDATTRAEKGRKTYTLRNEDLVPAVVYGAGTEPTSITISRPVFRKLYREGGKSSLINLSIDGGTALHVLVQDYQLDPVRDDLIHVDFRSIDMNKEIEADIPLVLTGEAPAVKALGGTLSHSHDSVRVRCLPKNLPHHIEIDLNVLETFDDTVTIKDLALGEGITPIGEESLVLATVKAPRKNRGSEEDQDASEEAPTAEADAAPAEETKE